MNIKKNHKIEDISKYLIENFNATEITIDEFLISNQDISEDTFEDISKILKIEDDLKEDCSSYVNKISTGKLIIIILESKDKTTLSGFTMEGAGQKLFDYLMSLIDEPIEKTSNPIDELIEELSHFRPYGKYFK